MLYYGNKKLNIMSMNKKQKLLYERHGNLCFNNTSEKFWYVICGCQKVAGILESTRIKQITFYGKKIER